MASRCAFRSRSTGRALSGLLVQSQGKWSRSIGQQVVLSQAFWCNLGVGGVTNTETVIESGQHRKKIANTPQEIAETRRKIE